VGDGASSDINAAMPPRSRPSTDVGAVVLTQGERTTGRALASLDAQTLPVRERVVVRDVAPFHRAFNLGVARATAPFFVQVDADMVLDREAVAVLRRAMAPDVGIAVGALGDPLMGRIAGVKMFRRECFGDLRLRDTVAPEIDFYSTLRGRGWQTACVADRPLGEHRPEYGPDYVFGTYSLLGARYALRDDARGLLWRITGLRRSPHAMAPIARIAMSHGLFARHARDTARPRPSAADSRFLHQLAATRHGDGPQRRIGRLLALDPRALFDGFRELGASLRAASHAGLRGCLRQLAELDGEPSLLAEIALGHGALAASASEPPDADASLASIEGVRVW
jgi:hypothetical protein